MFTAELEKLIALAIFSVCFFLILLRRIKISYVSLASAATLIALGIVTPEEAFFKAINWDVLGIYWGFGMLSIALSESKVPALIAIKIIHRAKDERHAIFYISALAAFLSSFMPNPVVVIMLAPIAIEIANRLKSSLFPYLVSLAISSNVVTTVTMIADPPAIILAMKTGMKFFDFYLFKGRIGLGAISLFGVIAALLTLLFQFRNMRKNVEIEEEKIKVTYAPTMLFVAGILALAFAPLPPGAVGLSIGLISLLVGRKIFKRMCLEFDWDTILFVVGIFIVISSLEITGILSDFVNWFASLGIKNSSLVLAVLVWVSVALSSFIDNVPYTVLMIPVCTELASAMGVSPFPFLFGMLIGTGIGGNITPVGATANVIACGMLEKRGYRIKLKEYLKISLPFSVIAVLVAHLLLQLTWL
jgi:Na+/H+ antiporter NhaD/arsenite permease-like protein